ncbi:Hypothetical predicted protein [Mytilus galloprovincialis]|uniref:Uncharacterized protein n=1 Tax=Mytilus galloprovincialis TaxID=29158 RepID=A0A8B6HJN9_MYTGA|nr:Hypothetical predicted protein [Mytilus galloprovincialis]
MYTTHREENQRLEKNVMKTEEYSDASKRWALVIPVKNACDTISGCILKNVSSEMSGPSKPDIFLYTAGSAILLLLVISIVLLLVCIRKYKSQANQIIRQNVHPNIDENEVATCNNERFYESIDKSAIYKSMHISNPAENLHDKKQSRSENSSTKSENYGYLDACSTYTEIKEPQMHCTRLNSYNSRGESSSSEYFKTGSGYIHPYQQLQQEQGQLKSAPAYVYTELICEFESSAFVPSLTHFHIAGRYSLPELHSTDQTQYNSLTNDNTNQPVKYSSI